MGGYGFSYGDDAVGCCPTGLCTTSSRLSYFVCPVFAESTSHSLMKRLFLFVSCELLWTATQEQIPFRGSPYEFSAPARK